MKVLRGIQQLGFYKTTKVYIDWNYLTQERGFRKEVDDLEKTLGMSLRLIVLVTLPVLLVMDLMGGRLLPLEALTPDRLLDGLFWLVSLLFIYSMYLLRDRTSFLDTLQIKKLDLIREAELKKHLPEEIELCDYFDFDVLNIFDDLAQNDGADFLVDLLIKLKSLEKVRSLLSRLGISEDIYGQVLTKAKTELNVSRDNWIHKAIFESFSIALTHGFDSVDERVVIIYLFLEPLKDILIDFKVLPDEVNGLLLWAQNDAKKQRYKKLWRERASLKPKNTVNRAYTSRIASTLEGFKRDFTLEAISGEAVLSIARENEISELIRLLSQGDKGAVIMVGEAGVGKTTMIQSLALRMVVEDVPGKLSDMRLLGFDFNKAYALSGSIESFRKIMEKVFLEVKEAKNIILVIDDFDQLVNIRDEAAAEIVSIIIEAVDRYNLRVIATSTPGGYDSFIKPQRTLVSLFDIVRVEEPSQEVSLQILIDEVPKLERKYGVAISLDSLRSTVKLSKKFAFDRVLPEKALDLIEEAASYANEKGLKFVSEKEVDLLVSKKVGVQVGALSEEEKIKLQNIEEIMHKRVIGQDKAVNAVAAALRRVRAGLTTGKRPIASFLFFGPTGVGKTEVAKTLAASYFGDEKFLIRIDMSEYQEEQNLSRLIGYQEGNDFMGGFLTEKVRERPFSLILLDELEKANPKVLDLFLQVLDEGSLTDGIGRKIDFTNTIIVATSNAGSKQIAGFIEQGQDYKSVYKNVISELRNVFRVEFLNRFDGVIMFSPLTITEVAQIAALMLDKIKEQLKEKGMFMEYDQNVLVELAKIGYNPVYGARELRRTIQTAIDDKIAELIIEGKLSEGKKVRINSLQNFTVTD